MKITIEHDDGSVSTHEGPGAAERAVRDLGYQQPAYVPWFTPYPYPPWVPIVTTGDGSFSITTSAASANT